MKKIIFQKTILQDISYDEWKKSLILAKKDDSVDISHAEVRGDSGYRVHIASIFKRVGCHFHKMGGEDYLIVSGKGELHWGNVDQEEMNVKWEKSIPVKTGDSFTIPEGCAHQLENREDMSDLIILFCCPDSHLSNDRIILKDSPNLVENK